MLWNFTFCSNATKFTNKLPIIYKSLVKGTKYKEYGFFKSFHSSPKIAFKVENFRSINKQGINDINTNIQNNVILYKCNHNKDSVKLRLLFIGTVCFHILVATSTFDSKYFLNWNKHTSWRSYFMENGFSVCLFTFSLIMGPLNVIFAYWVNQRFVKYIILHKGGNVVSLITNHAYKQYNTITVPINKIQTTQARSVPSTYLSLKLQGYKLYFFLDGNGKYLNKELFDYTVGLQKY